MGTVESKAEENNIIRFVDSAEVRHEKGPAIHGNDYVFTDCVPEDKGKIMTYNHCETLRSVKLYKLYSELLPANN